MTASHRIISPDSHIVEVGCRELERCAQIGVDNMMWGNDFPQAESTWPRSRQYIDRLFECVPADERRGITCDNAVAAFGFAV